MNNPRVNLSISEDPNGNINGIRLEAGQLAQLLFDAQLKHEMNPTTSSKNWLMLVRVVVRIHGDNLARMEEQEELRWQNFQMQAKMEVLENKLAEIDKNTTSGSSNGRKSDFDSDNFGSSPNPETTEQF